MRHLQDLDRCASRRRGDVGLGVGGEQHVRLAVARQEHDRALVRVLARQPGAVRPEHPKPQPTEPERRRRREPRRPGPRARRPTASAASSSALVAREPRVEHRVHGEPRAARLRAADVVALRCVSTSAESRRTPSVAQLPATSRFGRPLVDEDRALRHLEQDRSLPGRRRGTVIRRPVRRRERVGRPELPARAAPAATAAAHASAERAPPAREPPQDRGRQRRAEQRAADCDAGARSARTASRPTTRAHAGDVRGAASRSTRRARARRTARPARAARRARASPSSGPIASVTSAFASSA